MLSTLAARFRWLAWMLAFPMAAGAQVAGGDAVLAQNARMTLTVADYETALARLVPEKLRPEFTSRAKMIDNLLNTLLVRYTLAAEAQEAGLDREPLPPDADAKTILAQRMTLALDAAARADFDRRIEAFTAKAREEYLVTRKTYVTPEEVEFSLLYLYSTKRGDEAAREITNKLRADLLTGADFAKLAREYSDSEASAANGGRVPWVSRTDLDPWLEKSVVELKEVGDISGVVATKSGYYVVRLDGRRPGRQQTFEEVKDAILARMKDAHVAARRAAKTESIFKDPGLRVNQAAIDALLTPTDPEAMRKALRALESPLN